MRVTAIVLLAALLLNAAVAMPARAMRSCCCAKKSGASCPIKRATSKACEPGKGMSCNMSRSEAPATFTHAIVGQRPAILAATISVDAGSHVTTYLRPRFDVVTRTLRAPEPPPPKQA